MTQRIEGMVTDEDNIITVKNTATGVILRTNESRSFALTIPESRLLRAALERAETQAYTEGADPE